MTPVEREMDGPVLTFRLDDEAKAIRGQLESATRSARTLVKNDSSSVTLIELRAGGEIAPHRARGPITVQVLEGTLEFEADGRSWELSSGGLLALGPGIEHSVRSADGATFLLTVMSP